MNKLSETKLKRLISDFKIEHNEQKRISLLGYFCYTTKRSSFFSYKNYLKVGTG